jgi:hypothetical protein
MDRYLLISADGHAGPPARVYREYLDAQYRERFDAQQAELAATRAASPIGQGDKSEFEKEWELATDGDGGLTAAYDGAERNRVLDREGVVAEVLFPDADVLGTGRIASSPFGTGLAAGSQSEPELAVAGARAHNRWLADFCRDDPHRRIGVAVIPAIIPDMDTVLEMVREAKALGHRGILVPTRWFDRPPYNEPWYDPLWALVEDLDLVLHTHSGAGPTDFTGGYGLGPIYATEAGWWAGRPFHVFIWSGLFERFPRLRYSMAENAAWWVPDTIRKMEDDIARRYDVGVGNIMWGNDMPHPEGTFPFTRYFVRERFKDVPEDEARRMLGSTAAEVYGVDVAAVQPLVDRIGPTLEEVHGDGVVLDAPAEAIA